MEAVAVSPPCCGCVALGDCADFTRFRFIATQGRGKARTAVMISASDDWKHPQRVGLEAVRVHYSMT